MFMSEIFNSEKAFIIALAISILTEEQEMARDLLAIANIHAANMDAVSVAQAKRVCWQIFLATSSIGKEE